MTAAETQSAKKEEEEEESTLAWLLKDGENTAA